MGPFARLPTFVFIFPLYSSPKGTNAKSIHVKLTLKYREYFSGNRNKSDKHNYKNQWKRFQFLMALCNKYKKKEGRAAKNPFYWQYFVKNSPCYIEMSFCLLNSLQNLSALLNLTENTLVRSKIRQKEFFCTI